MLRDRKILLAVTGGIAAYKSCELVRLLLKEGAAVQVAMTAAATKFVAPLTFEALTGRRVALDLFAEGGSGTHHLDLVRDLDLMVVAPATANMIGKIAVGLADDLVSCSVLALSGPLLICPAMNPKMFAHPAVQNNLAILRDRGVIVMDPEVGEMASPQEKPGQGRLPEPAQILDQICKILPPVGQLSGKTIVVTAGPTQEPMDPVRVISNLSSGRMGYALAIEARRRGAQVHLIAGPVALPAPPGLTVTHVQTTAEMLKAVAERLQESHALIMAAAPADYHCAQISKQKLKKDPASSTLDLKLTKTPDILREASKQRADKVLVGFALETEPGIESAQKKLREKRLDFIILNHPSPAPETGLGHAFIQGTIMDAQGQIIDSLTLSKEQFAVVVMDHLQRLLANKTA